MTDQNQKPENPPAFPAYVPGGARPGMTLLDVFAKEAMKGLVINGTWTFNNIPEFAYDMAEKMLAERAKRGIR